jgi:hypothetical protein
MRRYSHVRNSPAWLASLILGVITFLCLVFGVIMLCSAGGGDRDEPEPDPTTGWSANSR